MWSHTASSCFSTVKPYLLGNYNTARFAKTLTPMSTLEESDVGISCFISQLPGFRGILKQRYSDFIVNEVDTDGNVVHLTCLDAPREVDDSVESCPIHVLEKDEAKISDQIAKSYASEIESFRALAGESDAELVGTLINQITSGNEDSVAPIILSPDYDKAHRTAMHNFFKNFKFLVTDTVDGPDTLSKCIRVRLNSGGHNAGRNSKKRRERGDKPFDSRGSDNWPEHLGKFLRFHLYKENKDTQEALGLIGKMLGIQPRSFGFAGTKDKRSVSTQRVTIFKQHASRLAALNERLIGIKVGDFCHVKEEILLGQLQGNRFTVTLRGVVADSEDTIKASADSLGRHGFINYFGLQRFGSGAVPTYSIGAALLRGEWKTAVNMILDPREGESNIISKARAYYRETNNIEGTLRQLPRHLVAERAILQCMKKCPGNYLQALKAIPRTLRMMYVHSYQSYLWNHAASVRVQKYGTDQVVLGDLVYQKGNDVEKVAISAIVDKDEGYADADDCHHSEEIAETQFSEQKCNLVKVVTAEDIGSYYVDDVVLPMPGSRVIYPMNDIAEVYHDLAKKDAINLMESIHNVKEFSITSMTGSYRRVFQKPINFEWELLTYTDSNIPLAETDLDRLSKSKSVDMIYKEEPCNGNEEKDLRDSTGQSECTGNGVEVREQGLPYVEPLSDPKSLETQMALKLGFTLPSSCYATMAIRELLKTSTSVAFHKKLNQ